MRIVVASCSVIYTGRGDTKLPQAVRAIILKDDGCISIHNDKSNKPLNYMGKGNVHTETKNGEITMWTFDTRKESLQITMHEVLSDTSFEIDLNDAGLIRDGTEKHLQAWLAEHPESLGEGFTFVAREHQTGAGPVDLLLADKDDNLIAVEVKRIAMTASVDQIRRYVEALQQDGMENVRGMIAALDVRPNTVKMAERRGIDWAIIPTYWRETAFINEEAESDESDSASFDE